MKKTYTKEDVDKIIAFYLYIIAIQAISLAVLIVYLIEKY